MDQFGAFDQSEARPQRAVKPVNRCIDTYVAKVPSEVWDEIVDFVKDSVRATAPGSATAAASLLTATAHLVAYCFMQGWALDAQLVFDPETIDAFVAHHCKNLSPGTKSSYRSYLREVGRALLGTDVFPERPVLLKQSSRRPPYTRKQQSIFRAWAQSLKAAQRHDMLAILAMALGAGLTSFEMSSAVGADVRRSASGVVTITVVGNNARTVTVLREWETTLLELAAEVGDRPIIRPHRTRVTHKDVWRRVEDCGGPSIGRPEPRRLRTTWIVRHLAAHTPNLAAAAGIKPQHLAWYLQFVEAPAEGDIEARYRDPEGR